MLKRRRLKHLPAWIFVSIALLALLSGKRRMRLLESRRGVSIPRSENLKTGNWLHKSILLYSDKFRQSTFKTIHHQSIYLNGSGVAAGDYDGDGLCDLFFCGLDSENKLYVISVASSLRTYRKKRIGKEHRINGCNFR